MQDMEDQFMARCRAKDPEALAQVYADHERAVFRYAYHLIGNHEEAHDIKQETFLRAFSTIHSFRNQCRLQSWLFKICTNLCRDKIRALKRRGEILCDPHLALERFPQAENSIDPHTEVERTETHAIIMRILRAMPADQRELIILREIENLSCKEIADIMGCSVSSVRVKLSRARDRFIARVESALKSGR